MHTVVENIERPDQDVVDAFEGVPASIVADVSGKYECAMDHEIKPVWDVDSMVGTALTVKTYPGDNLMIHKAVTLAEPGDVIVVDANAYPEAGLWGDLLSESALAHDLRGTIVDGAVRDVNDVAELGYPLYARAVSPKGSYKGHPGSINVPISCGGVTVEPGDVVVGDAEGVAIVRANRAEAVAELAGEKLEGESALRERLVEGEYIFDDHGLAETYDRLDIEHRS